MRRGPGISRIFKILLAVAAITSLLGFIVMSLWNAILPNVLHVQPLNFWQALGILVLSKILFGGFQGGWHRKRAAFRERMREKWQSMTPEERKHFRQELKNRCGAWSSRFRQAPNRENEPGSTE